MAKLRRSRSPKSTILRTNAEIAGWLFSLDCRRKLARVTQCEAACAEILRQPESDPRRPGVPRMQGLLVVARSNLAHGHGADWQMAEIERLGALMDKKVLGPLAARGASFDRRGKKPRGPGLLTQEIEKLLTANLKLPAKDVTADLKKRAIVKVKDGRVEWRPKIGSPSRSVTMMSFTNRISRTRTRLQNL
jgi:hypothetical protein